MMTLRLRQILIRVSPATSTCHGLGQNEMTLVLRESVVSLGVGREMKYSIAHNERGRKLKAKTEPKICYKSGSSSVSVFHMV